MSPERLGRYRLDGVIGVGSFATAHRATDERLDADVVVKVLAENHSLNPEVRERFIAEGRSLRRVRSPHVVTVHDIGESPRQQPYLVLEHADRGTLAHRVATLRETGWTARTEDVLILARTLAAALEAVHAAQLVHRDLSPANVLLTSAPGDEAGPEEGADGGDGRVTARPTGTPTLVAHDERLLLADLGLCKDLAVNSGLTVAGGTAGFRPPEMDAGPAVIDTRADLWSLSALVRWVCEGSTLADTLGPVLGRSLSVDPGRRHQDVRHWLRDVERALAPARATGPSTPQTGRSPGRRALLVVPLLVLLLGLGAGWLLRGAGSPPEATRTARIAVEGPVSTTVGEQATFTLRHLGVESWVWVLPTGEHVVDQESITLTPSGSGRAVLTVSARDEEGAELRTEHRLDVTAP